MTFLDHCRLRGLVSNALIIHDHIFEINLPSLSFFLYIKTMKTCSELFFPVLFLAPRYVRQNNSLNKKLLKSSSSSSLAAPPLPPPPFQFANSSSNHHLQKSSSKIKVLPALNTTVTLNPKPPQQQHQQPRHHSSQDTIDADKLIEELMREAETDPGLRELSGLSRPPQAPPLINEKYPMVKRPYRTAQDMIIKDKPDGPSHESPGASRNSFRPMEKHKLVERPYRTNDNIKIVEHPSSAGGSLESRSKSADARVSGMRRVDPKLSGFKRTSSNDNFQEELLHEVVTDQDHTSVKDLVCMIEKNTKSESANPYVRKWGCDLISPEPHTRNVTYRREKKQFEDQMKKQQLQTNEQGIVAKPTHNWTQDDAFQRRNKVDFNDNVDSKDYLSVGTNGGYELGNEFRLSAHTADLDDLLGRPPQGNQTHPQQYKQEHPRNENEWNKNPQHNYANLTHYQNHAEHNNIRSNEDKYCRSKNIANNERSAVRGGNDPAGGKGQYQDIDRQISNIQDEFETELDSLIDTYREMKKVTKSSTTASNTAASKHSSTTSKFSSANGSLGNAYQRNKTGSENCVGTLVALVHYGSCFSQPINRLKCDKITWTNKPT